ncbi:DUF3306 domain-containing protein [Shewanella sp. D64]|uniref:DUF3306 domain-containing protein n=1 Tax=unclassified Shewanella TaxID=196818 RepID=UPI0022BA48F6|nr:MULTISPECIES: DUF3306 domain-containing protein [unclassified Shewanella]MEC4726270.1 DUF3306 domain-containing protein [Shewanella sp. D64]MEC4738282.1 DUF3306 domain-containing protein [Shewanella sp. E94]WBJ95419.1 DUF3306 domain-containing protein [Shewanella sp. MTB7]
MSGLLSRWNLRRQKVEEEKLAEDAELVAEQAEIVQEPSVTAPLSDQAAEQQSVPETEKQILTAEDLPDPEKIEIGGSFASFMGANVDPLAKAAALKALWKQPQYSEIDGLLEYALDYSNQPKLTAEHSAELAKKIFRHVTKSDDETAENEALELAQTEPKDTRLLSDTTEDILDGTIDEVPQNEPESGDEPKSSVS